jgi:hypothetical protein
VCGWFYGCSMCHGWSWTGLLQHSWLPSGCGTMIRVLVAPAAGRQRQGVWHCEAANRAIWAKPAGPPPGSHPRPVSARLVEQSVDLMLQVVPMLASVLCPPLMAPADGHLRSITAELHAAATEVEQHSTAVNNCAGAGRHLRLSVPTGPCSRLSR